MSVYCRCEGEVWLRKMGCALFTCSSTGTHFCALELSCGPPLSCSYWICPSSEKTTALTVPCNRGCCVPRIYSPRYEKEVLVHSELLGAPQKLVVVLLPSLENPFPLWLPHVSLNLETPCSLLDDGLSWHTVFLSPAASLCLSNWNVPWWSLPHIALIKDILCHWYPNNPLTTLSYWSRIPVIQ